MKRGSRFGSGNLDQMTDEALVEAVTAGRHDAIAVLFDRYARLVFRIAKRILRDSGEAEEVLQTVFLDIFQFAAKFDPKRGSVRVWLLQYVYHRSIRRKQTLESRYFYTTEHIDSVICEIVKNSPRRVFNLSPQETSRLVNESLMLVEEQHRRTIEMTYFEGLTAEEIAERTGKSVSTVRHNLYRGRVKLRERLSPTEGRHRKAAKKESPFREGGIVDVRA